MIILTIMLVVMLVLLVVEAVHYSLCVIEERVDKKKAERYLDEYLCCLGRDEMRKEVYYKLKDIVRSRYQEDIRTFESLVYSPFVLCMLPVYEEEDAFEELYLKEALKWKTHRANPTNSKYRRKNIKRDSIRFMMLKEEDATCCNQYTEDYYCSFYEQESCQN